MITQITVPRARSRTNIIDSSSDDCDVVPRSMLLGAYTRRGVGVTTNCGKHQDLLREIHKLARLRPHPHCLTPYCAVQINAYSSLKAHRDMHNMGSTWLIACGPFKGGKLWLANDHGTVRPPRASVETCDML
eukprot:732394-Amphidinium_carterae.1